jgi:undecaprenyl-diphosphatase
VIAGAAAPGGDPVIGLLDAFVLGLVEGLTEFLPISSTGHLIVAQRLLGLPSGGDNNVYVIGIQVGAITAILVLYWRRLFDAGCAMLRPERGQPNLLVQILIAALPASVVGLAFDGWIDRNLFTSPVVATAMVVGGVLLLVVERRVINSNKVPQELAQMSYSTALWIGLFQCLALVPGTSRAAATIAGALLLGLSRTAAAEFSFLVGLPILYGASLWKLVSQGGVLKAEAAPTFLVGTIVSFLAALAVVRPFVRFLRHHTFAPFAWYRIVGGLILAWMCWRGLVD